MDERKEKRIGSWKGILLIALCAVLLLSTGVGTAKYAQQIEVEENLTLDIFAQVIVTLNYMDGKSASEEFSYEGTLPTPERAGYTFDGWYIGIEGADAWTYGDKLTGDPENGETLLAKWSINEYSISYDLGGGNLEENIENPEIYTVENEDIVLNNPTKIGYAFLGWTGSNGETAQMTVNIPKGSTGDKTYIANWEAVPTAYLYSDGSFVFTNGGETSLDTSRTLAESYTGWSNSNYESNTQPWADRMASITSVTIQDGVSTSIGDYWFYNGANISSINIGSGVTVIGNHAFENCQSLTGDFTITNNITTIGAGAFKACGLNRVLTIGSKVTTIGQEAFYDNDILAIKMPSSVTSLGTNWTNAPSSEIEGSDGNWHDYDTNVPYLVNEIPTRKTAVYVAIKPIPTAYLYSNGSFVFCRNQWGADTSLTLQEEYVDWDTQQYTDGTQPWYPYMSSIKSVTIQKVVNPQHTDYWFYNATNLASVTFGNDLTSIGEYTFYNCANLTGTISIPSKVTVIGNSAFQNCARISSLSVGSSVTTIGDNAFNGCVRLRTVDTAYRTTSLGTDWLPVPDPAYLSGADGNWYNYYTNKAYLVKDIPTGTSTTYIAIKPIPTAYLYTDGSMVFYRNQWGSGYNKTLSKTYTGWNETQYTAGTQPWVNEMAAIKTVEIVDDINPDKTAYWFYGATNLTEVYIGKSVTSIGDYAFYNCPVIDKVSVFTSLKTFGTNWLSASSSGYWYNEKTGVGYTVAQIPAQTEAIYRANRPAPIPTAYLYEDGYFAFCCDQFSIDSSRTLKESYTGWDTGSYNNYYSTPWYNRLSSIKTVYISDDVIPESTAYWFYNASYMTEAYIGSGVSSIGKYAFYGCSKLTGALTIPGTVTSIGEYAFNRCTGLTGVTIGAGVQTIGSNAFNGCNKIERVVLPDSIVTLGSNWIHTPNSSYIDGATGKWYDAANGNTYTPATIPTKKAATYVALNPFEPTAYLYSDGSMYFFNDAGTVDPNKTLVKSYIGWKEGSYYSYSQPWYSNLSAIKSVYISDGITPKSTDYWFYGASNLKEVYIGNGITSIGTYMFYNCSSLEIKDFTLPAQITSIGSYAFQNCSKITGALTIPEGVTSISSYAFNGCNKISSITLPSTVTTLSYNWIHNPSSSYIDGADGNWYDSTGKGYSSSSIPTRKAGTYTAVNPLTPTAYLYSDGSMYFFNNVGTLDPDKTLVKTYADWATTTNSSVYWISWKDQMTSITSVYISDDVTPRSTDYWFYGATNLRDVYIGKSVTALGGYMFYNCTNLQTITIPAAATSFGYNWLPTPSSGYWYDLADGTAYTVAEIPTGKEATYTASSPALSSVASLSLRAQKDVTEGYITGETQSISSMPNVTALNEKAAADAPSKASLSGWMIDSGFAQQLSSIENLEIVLQAIYAEAPDWEMTLTPLYEDADVGELLLACATKELGTRESTSDYIWLETGEYKGYTKYGAYYGLPYGDWCAMFIGWCMDQVGLGDLPFSPGCYIWVDMAKEAGLYRNAAEYVPGPGDIAFIDYDADTYADHVVIVKSVDLENGTYTTIEGNYSNSVMEVIRPLNTHTIGYMVVSNKGIEQEVTLSQADGSSIPVNPAEPGNDMVPTKPSETTEPSVPETSETGTTGTTESSVPEATEPTTTEPAVPDITVPPVSDTTVSTEPDMPNSSVPEATVPSSSATTETTVPDNTVPSVPETTVPPVTDTTEPAVPDTTGTTVPDTTTPDTTVPTESNATEPPVPTTDDPASKETEPTIPSSETPSVPKETETVVSQPVTSSEPVVSTTLPNAAAVDPDEAEELEKEQDSPVETTETSKENQ